MTNNVRLYKDSIKLNDKGNNVEIEWFGLTEAEKKSIAESVNYHHSVEDVLGNFSPNEILEYIKLNYEPSDLVSAKAVEVDIETYWNF